MRFREAALKARETSDVLDLPVRLTSARGWLAAVAVAVAVAIGLVWAFVARMPQEVTAVGLLTTPDGSFAVQTPRSGQIIEVYVEPGSVVNPGTSIARIRDDSGASGIVRSWAQGQVFAVRARVGQVVEAGAPLAVAENTQRKSEGLVAAVYIPAALLATVTPGNLVRLAVASAPGRGALLGRVRSVAQTPETPGDIGAFLGDDELGTALAGKGARYRVVVTLGRRPGAATEYTWTSPAGSPVALSSRTAVVASIEQPSVRPADWIFPS
jgi:pyruvate/2-oxoglutarate dehydrogenase complex dihydrolipoamide acyltransferase (E2) component